VGKDKSAGMKKAVDAANKILMAMHDASSRGAVLLSYDPETEQFSMISINSSEVEVVQMLVFGMDAMKDVARAQVESLMEAEKGSLN
jgi:hypothetical protein